MDLGLTDRVYVLTGASRGLGFATAECLVADGARVVISARKQSTVDDAVAKLGPNAYGVSADLADPSTPDSLVEAARSRFGRLDGALLSVGGPPMGRVLDVTDEQWLGSFQTLFLGAVRAARAVAAALAPAAVNPTPTDPTAANTTPANTTATAGRADGGGVIGLVLSTSVRAPIPALSISNALRPGLAGMAKDLADELGPRGIRVFSLLPGRIMTDRNVELFAATGDPEKARADAAAAIPLRRIGEPAEFGRVAAFLLSPAAGYVTGVAVPVDGGATRSI
jgi:3-oxoacyl-[acyl-carrier protein] reductase